MLKATVSNITGDNVQLSMEDGQVLRVSVTAIEGMPKVGSEVAVVVAALGSEDAGRTKLAQDLLNGLLKA